MDWNKRNFHFEVPKEETSKCKALPISWFGENQDYHLGVLEDDPKLDMCIQNLACKRNLKMCKDPNTQSFCLWEDEISCKLLKKEIHFLYMFFLTQDPKVNQNEILLIYQTYKNVFENKNIDMLLKHQPYNCAINLEEGT
jgi:hypothetical protein